MIVWQTLQCNGGTLLYNGKAIIHKDSKREEYSVLAFWLHPSLQA